jgi:hypothetical protein
VTGVLAALAALSPVADSDIFWHLAAGREMVRTGAVLRSDPFSIGAAGRPWIDVHWLFQLIAHAGYRAGGLLALVLGKAILVGLGAGLLHWAVLRGVSASAARPEGEAAGPERDPLVALVGAALLALLLPAALLSIRHLLLVRPVILTLLFLAGYLLVLESYRCSGRPRRLLLLPAFQIVWANCQGLAVLGPALLVGVLAGGLLGRLLRAPELPARGERHLGGVLALCLLAGLVTPFGLSAFTLPLRLFGRIAPDAANVFSQNIAENVPPFILERSMPGQVAPLAAVLGLCALSFALARRELMLGRALAALGFAGLALMANRNLLLFFWIAVPLAAMNLAAPAARGLRRLRASPRPLLRRLPALGAAGWGLGVAAVAVAAVAGARAETSLSQPAPFRVPSESAAIIAGEPGAGRIFNADHYGGYLIWALYPRARPFIDTRLVLRTADEYAEYLGLADHPERFGAFARRHRFDHVALPTEFPDRYLGLVQALYRDPAWRLVYTDGTETLFRSADHPAQRPAVHLGERATTERVLADIDRRHGDEQVRRAARRHLARLQMAVGEGVEARYVLERAPEEDLAALALLGRCQLMLGAAEAAEGVARRLLAAGERVAAHNLLAMVALARGDQQAAVDHLGRALGEDPHDAEARGILEGIEAQQAPPPP